MKVNLKRSGGNRSRPKHSCIRSPQKRSELNQVHPFDTARYVAAVFALALVALADNTSNSFGKPPIIVDCDARHCFASRQ